MNEEHFIRDILKSNIDGLPVKILRNKLHYDYGFDKPTYHIRAILIRMKRTDMINCRTIDDKLLWTLHNEENKCLKS